LLRGGFFIVQQTVTVSSGDVDKISKAGQKTAQLLQAGIIVVGGYGQGIRYVFNGLNALKPDMITEATKNARASTDEICSGLGEPGGVDPVGESGGVFYLGGGCGERDGAGRRRWRRRAGGESGCEHHEEGSRGLDCRLLSGSISARLAAYRC